MTAYVIADIQVTDTAAYEPHRPLAAASIAQFGGRFILLCAAARSICSKAIPSRNVSSSSNLRIPIPAAAGAARRNTRTR